MIYIGIDLGTSAVKLLAMDERGAIQSMVSKEYPLYFPKPGWSEQNPKDWYERTVEGLKELVADIHADEVAGIGVGGQMHGLVALDCRDQPVRPAILWNDGRSEKQTAWLNETVGKKRLTRYTANIAFAGFTAPKILWMRENEPELFQKTAKIMLPKDYITYRLSGVCSTDYSDASGMLLLDVRRKRWSKEMLEVCGIRRELLPALYESYEVTGTLKPETAAELGLKKGIKIVAGAGDNAAAAVGAGTVGEGRCNISLGTSGTIFISGETFRADENNALHSFNHADGNYHLMGCMLSAASCSKWWLESILKTEAYETEQKQIASLGENSVFFLPYLMGERSPHNDPGARAMFAGMTMDTGRADMTQAVMEGVVFGLRDSLEVAKKLGLSPERTNLCGGGAKSLLWRKMTANILNMKVETAKTENGPGYGAAILAAVGCGEFPDVKTAARQLAGRMDTVEPDPVLAAKYEQKYRKFREFYPAVKELFHY